MKNGYRVIDTDTHVGPNLETLEQYAGPVLRERWGELADYFSPITDGGHQLSISPYPYRRKMRESTVLDDGASRAGQTSPLKGAVTAVLDTPPSAGINNLNATGRLHDMDVEGVDVHLIIPATFATAVSALDVEMANEIHDAYRRYIGEYCSADPQRLKATVPVLAADPERAADVVREAARRGVGGRDHPGAPRGPADRRPRARPDVGGDERRRPADHAPLVLLRAAVLPRVPRHVGQRGGGAGRRPPVGRPAAARLPHLQRAVRPVPQPAHRLRRVQRRAGCRRGSCACVARRTT